MISEGGYAALMSIVIAVIGAVAWAVVRPFVQSVRDALDEVVDEGDALVIRKNGIQDRVALSRVVAVFDGHLDRYQTIVLRFDPPSAFGKEVVFFPKFRFSWNWLSPIVGELRERIKHHTGKCCDAMEGQEAEPGVGADSR